ncbi:MAG TPA: hypothetical protein VGB90_03045 [Alphaproteobacteria bacterium]
MIRSVRVVQIVCLCVAAIAARPAVAGISPQPFLEFNSVPNNASAAHFEVAIPPDPVIPVEILTLSLIGPDAGVVLVGSVGPAFAGGPTNGAGIVDVNWDGGVNPDPFVVDLTIDFAPFMGSNPVSGTTPDDGITGPVDAFDVMFDVLIDGGIVHHVMAFAAADGLMFSDVEVSEGSILIGFVLDGTLDTHLFTVTITGSAEPLPAPGGSRCSRSGLPGSSSCAGAAPPERRLRGGE